MATSATEIGYPASRVRAMVVSRDRVRSFSSLQSYFVKSAAPGVSAKQRAEAIHFIPGT